MLLDAGRFSGQGLGLLDMVYVKDNREKHKRGFESFSPLLLRSMVTRWAGLCGSDFDSYRPQRVSPLEPHRIADESERWMLFLEC